MTTTKWLEVRDANAQKHALALARGCYQRALLLGEEAWSGSTLKGKAARYSGRYYHSRWSLFDRLRAAGIKIEIIARRPGGRHVIVLG